MSVPKQTSLARNRRRNKLEIDLMRNIGAQMSNVCFNLSQRPGKEITSDSADSMRTLYQQWDAIRKQVAEV
jgi:hypothetical protein